MKKEFKIHDFVIGMKIRTLYRDDDTIISIQHDGPLPIGCQYLNTSPDVVQEILYDPRIVDSPKKYDGPNWDKMNTLGITKFDETGIYYKADKTWHIPDDYIKPGIKVNCRYDWNDTDYRDIVSISSIEDGYVYFSDNNCDAFLVVKECLEKNGPEWSWAADKNPRRGSKEAAKQRLYFSSVQDHTKFGNAKCDCGAVSANTTHSTWCSIK